MSEYTNEFRRIAATYPDRIAYCNSAGESITYAELDRKSDGLGSYLNDVQADKNPVVLYGHKSPLMYVGLLASLKTGRAYVPVDTVYPEGRLAGILDQLEQSILINTTDTELPEASKSAVKVLGKQEVERLCEEREGAKVPPEEAVQGDDIMYIMFTSGSTGQPKGVMMHAGSIDHFLRHFTGIMDSHPGDVYFNRVPLSFDMSIFDIVPGLATGGTLYSLESQQEGSLKATFEALRESHATQWTSTPSFVEACLTDPSFNQDMMPQLRLFALGGEVLRNNTAERLLDAFPNARLINAYGPTETESVSEQDVTREIVETCNPIPVGYMSPTMRAVIRDPETLAELPVGQIGEIYLAGHTVSKGYYKRPDLTEAAYSTYETEDGELLPCYKTGDKGYLDEKGRLYCLGRYDFQVKIGGFRIEISEIEECLSSFPEVAQACVVPVWRNGSIAHVCAFVQLSDGEADTSYAQTRSLKAKLKAVLPDYMVPRAFRYVDEMPTNTNGKIDRKALGELAGSR